MSSQNRPSGKGSSPPLALGSILWHSGMDSPLNLIPSSWSSTDVSVTRPFILLIPPYTCRQVRSALGINYLWEHLLTISTVISPILTLAASWRNFLTRSCSIGILFERTSFKSVWSENARLRTARQPYYREKKEMLIRQAQMKITF